MLHSFWTSFFGCAHQRTTFPLTPNGSPTNPSTARKGTYVACLDCGEELAYDWESMHVGAPLNHRAAPRREEPLVQHAFRGAATMVAALIRR